MRKADGVTFEKEFKDKMHSKYYVRRLPTLRSYAGLTQPADFILIGNAFNYVELKETGADRFSVSTMRQYPEVKEFLEEREKLRQAGLKCKTNYWLVVRFIDRGICAIANETILKFGENKRTLKPDSHEAIRVDSIEDLREENIF